MREFVTCHLQDQTTARRGILGPHGPAEPNRDLRIQNRIKRRLGMQSDPVGFCKASTLSRRGKGEGLQRIQRTEQMELKEGCRTEFVWWSGWQPLGLCLCSLRDFASSDRDPRPPNENKDETPRVRLLLLVRRCYRVSSLPRPRTNIATLCNKQTGPCT
jgi:hypothetical protein